MVRGGDGAGVGAGGGAEFSLSIFAHIVRLECFFDYPKPTKITILGSNNDDFDTIGNTAVLLRTFNVTFINSEALLDYSEILDSYSYYRYIFESITINTNESNLRIDQLRFVNSDEPRKVIFQLLLNGSETLI